MESDFTYIYTSNGILKFLSQTTLTNCCVSPPTIDKPKFHLSDPSCAMEGFKARIQKEFCDCLQVVVVSIKGYLVMACAFRKLDFTGILDISRILMVL